MSRMDEYLMAIITGENEDLPEPRSGFEREFYEAAKKGLGGASSWNELTDRPFGETTVTGDTLVFDNENQILGQTTAITGTMQYLVSENAPTLDEVSMGATFFSFVAGAAVSLEVNDMSSTAGCEVYFLNYNGATIAIGLAEDFNGGSKGLYLSEFGSLTINNYNGFETTETVPLPNKYLDIIETVGGDTLTWDGDTSGRVCFADAYFLVSNSTPALADFGNGFTLKTNLGAEMNMGQSDIRDVGSGVLLCDGRLIVAPEDGITVEGMTFEKKGLYLTTEITSLTINGYTGFTKEQVKQEYLPSGATVFYTNTDTGDSYLYKKDQATKITKAELAQSVGKLVIIRSEIAGEIVGEAIPCSISASSFLDYGQVVTVSMDNETGEPTLMPYYTAEYTS